MSCHCFLEVDQMGSKQDMLFVASFSSRHMLLIQKWLDIRYGIHIRRYGLLQKHGTFELRQT